MEKEEETVIVKGKEYAFIKMPFFMQRYDGQCTIEQLNEAYYSLYPCFQKILKEEHGEDFTHERIVNHKTNKKRYQYYQTAITALTENLKLITTKEIRKKNVRPTSKTILKIIVGSEEYPLIKMPFLMNMYEGEFTLEQLNEAYYRLNENYKTILKEEHGEGFTHDKTVDYKTDKKRYSLYSTASSKLTNNLRSITGRKIKKGQSVVMLGSEDYPIIQMPFFMQRYDGQYTVEQLNKAYYKLLPCYQKILKEEHGEDFSHDKTVDYKVDSKRYSLYSNAVSELNNNLIEIIGHELKKKKVSTEGNVSRTRTQPIEEFNKITSEDVILFKKTFTTSFFKELTGIFSLKESIVFVLKYGTINKRFTNNAISSFLDVDIEEINQITAFFEGRVTNSEANDVKIMKKELAKP